MRKPEAALKSDVRKKFKYDHSVYLVDIKGDESKSSGDPDMIFNVGGVFVAMEFKSSTGSYEDSQKQVRQRI